MDRFSKMMDVWIPPAFLRRGGGRTSTVKSNKAQAEKAAA